MDAIEHFAGPSASSVGVETFVGYYDVSPWSSDGQRFLLHRKRPGKDSVEIVALDRTKSSVAVIAETFAWNHQQGARLQWASDRVVAFNDLVDGRSVARFWDLTLGESWLIPFPLQAMCGDHYVSISIARLNVLNPAYGYVHDVTPILDPDSDGLRIVNWRTGEERLAVSLSRVLAAGRGTDRWSRARSKLNHVMFSPSGKRIVFLHRWYQSGRRQSRLLVYDLATEDLVPVLDSGMVSHYCWLNNDELLVFGRAADGEDCFLKVSCSGAQEKIGIIGRPGSLGDGHPYLMPSIGAFVVDSYPGRDLIQHLGQVNLETGQYSSIGQFVSPLAFRGDRRCDLHPRVSPIGGEISIDATFEGRRRTYIVHAPDVF